MSLFQYSKTSASENIPWYRALSRKFAPREETNQPSPLPLDFGLHYPGSPKSKLCPLVGSGVLAPWIILKTKHFVWSTGLPNKFNVFLLERLIKLKVKKQQKDTLASCKSFSHPTALLTSNKKDSPVLKGAQHDSPHPR